MILEICAGNYQSAYNADKTGAQRIELCSNLEVGGLTPDEDLLSKAAQNLSIKTFVLVRPRAGDFVYSDQEFELMKHSIKKCKELKFAGIVSGVLKADKTIDIERTKEIVELTRPLDFTFHRAFDEVANPHRALEQLIELKVDRILTSGQKPVAEKGLDLLTQLKKEADDRIMILPGSGINPQNARLFIQSGFKEIHASATKKTAAINDANEELISDIATIKSILDQINV